METEVEKMIREIPLLAGREELQRIQDILQTMQHYEQECDKYTRQKKKVWEELNDLKETMKMQLEKNEQNEHEKEIMEAKLIAKTGELKGTRVVDEQELVNGEEKLNSKVHIILKKSDHFKVSESGKNLMCNICEDNW